MPAREVKCRQCDSICEPHVVERPVKMHTEGMMHLSSVVTHEHTGMYYCTYEKCLLYKVLREP